MRSTALGQLVPSGVVQPEMRLADVAGEDLEMALGECSEALEQLGVRAQRRLDALPGVGGVGAAGQAHQGAARISQSLKPFHAEEAAQETGGAGQQDGANFRCGLGQ